MECLGCRIANGIEQKINPQEILNIHTIYENELVSCVLDIDPFNEGHTLILPKRHYTGVDDMDSKTACATMEASKKISVVLKKLFKPDGITICQNGGIFDELTHFHMHVVPRYKGQNFADFYAEDAETVVVDEVKLSETERKMIDAIHRINN